MERKKASSVLHHHSIIVSPETWAPCPFIHLIRLSMLPIPQNGQLFQKSWFRTEFSQTLFSTWMRRPEASSCVLPSAIPNWKWNKWISVLVSVRYVLSLSYHYFNVGVLTGNALQLKWISDCITANFAVQRTNWESEVQESTSASFIFLSELLMKRSSYRQCPQPKLIFNCITANWKWSESVKIQLFTFTFF